MTVHTLETFSIQDITNVFNQAFDDYIIPIQLTQMNLLDKIKSENIFLDYSIGISVEGKLVAFMLTGIDSKDNTMLSYNAGTGVIPEFRGNHFPQKMYDHLLPLLRKNNITYHKLEVITQNTKAIQIYEKLGYQISKQVSCFKGTASAPNSPSPFIYRRIDVIDESEVQPFWNHQPTYQNTLSSINRNSELHESIGAFFKGNCVGYIIFVTTTGRIKQFGVHPDFRQKGIGKQLFYEVQKNNPNSEVSLINIDNNDSETISFLQKINLNRTVEQFEMILNQ